MSNVKKICIQCNGKFIEGLNVPVGWVICAYCLKNCEHFFFMDEVDKWPVSEWNSLQERKSQSSVLILRTFANDLEAKNYMKDNIEPNINGS